MIVLECFCGVGSELNVKTHDELEHNFEDNIAYCRVVGHVAGNGHELMADNEVGWERIAGYRLEGWLGMSTVDSFLAV